jgi:hypothetical protein
MTQKTEQNYNRDYYDTYGKSDNQNRWIWGSLAALAVLAGIVWFASQGGPSTSPAPTAATTQEEPAAPPAAPAAEQPAPAQGGQSGQTNQTNQ